MTQADIIALMRSGALRLAVRSSVVEGETEPGITLSGDPSIFTPEFLQSFQRYQIELFKMVRRNDVQVCLSPSEHRSAYCFRVDHLGKVFMCPMCEALRSEALRELPPVEDCIQLVNMQPI